MHPRWGNRSLYYHHAIIPIMALQIVNTAIVQVFDNSVSLKEINNTAWGTSNVIRLKIFVCSDVVRRYSRGHALRMPSRAHYKRVQVRGEVKNPLSECHCDYPGLNYVSPAGNKQLKKF